MTVCSKCGRSNEDDCKVCLDCGEELPQTAPAPGTPAPGKITDSSAVGHAWRQVIAGQECHLTDLDARAADPRSADVRSCPLPLLFLRERLGVLGSVFASHKRLLRLLGWLICLFPILLIPKLVLLFVRDKVGTILVGDLITIAWVGLLLVFFATVSVYLLLFAFVGPRSRRRTGWTVAPPGDIPLERALAGVGEKPGPPARPDANELHQLVDSLLKGEKPAPEAPLLLRGEVRRFGGTSELLEDSWYEYPSGVLRELRGLPFIVAAQGQPPIVVAPGSGVTILAAYAREDAGPRSTPPWEEQVRSAHHFVLAEGRRIELVAGEVQAVASIDELVVHGVAYHDDAQGEVPYRGGGLRPALLVSSSPESPLLIRQL